MWNSWMENAKAMAADLDTKLNDAVGMDDDGNAIDTPKATQTSTAPSANLVARTPLVPSAATAAAAVTTIPTTTTNDDNDDAWNDDFDFGDEDDDDMADAKPSESAKPIPAVPVAAAAPATPQSISIPKPKPAEPIVKLATPVAKTPPRPSATPKTTTPIVPKTLGASLNTPKPAAAAASTTKPKPKPIPTPVVSKVEAAATPAKESATPAKESPQPPSKPVAKQDTAAATVTSATTPSVSNEAPITPPIDVTEDAGWDGDDDLDVDLDDHDEADAPQEETDTTSPPPPKDSIAKDAKKEEAPASSSTAATTPASGSGGGMFSNFSTLAKTADSFLTSAVQEDAAKAEPEPKRETDAEQDSETKEALDPKTTSPVPSPVAPINSETTTATTNAVSTPKNTIPASPPKATPKPKAAATPAPKFTPGGSLFSNLSGLAKTADSLLTAAVEQSAGVVIGETSEPIDETGGWDEDNDDAFFDDDDDDGDNDETNNVDVDKLQPAKPTSPTNVPTGAAQEKVKTEESTASFVKVSPTSSISTPEVLPHKASIPQPPKEADTTKEPPQSQSSTPSPDGKVTEADTKPSAPIPSANIEDDPRYRKLQETLQLREEQLMDKGAQLNELQLLLESRDEQYKKKLSDTKEEAKKRILRAKERCEAAEAKLKARSAGDSEDAKKKQLIIDELMEEGQALAEKQSVMERAVREANAEARGLAEQVRQESQEKEQALDKIQELEAQCKSLKESLASARKGESQAGKLENDLLSARADAEEKANTILSLQQRLKEFTAESKELRQEIDATRKSAAHAAQQEQTSMRKEHNDLIGDLEQKLRTTEREAGVREDALRHEISEIRKRWQDSVRRADALSMDIQSSTAPLLRQLESMERQNRLRVANASELESRLRSEVEEATIENERLAKESSEFKAKLSKLERSVKDRDQELSKAQSTLEEQAQDLEALRTQEEKLLADAQARQAEYEKVERLANEGVARVRSEMSQTVADSEERYRGQIERLQKELATEEEKRTQLEAQVSQLLESGGGLFAAAPPAASMNAPHSLGIKRESKPKKLHKAENQASILAGALGLGDDTSDEDDSDFESDDDDQLFDTNDDEEGEGSTNPSNSGGGGGYHSFAAIEQLSSKLKTSEVELKSMRKSLKESNELNQSLVEELGEARAAKEKLPLFEAKVKELTQENKQLELEVAGLKEDIADTKELYGSQLHAILEAQVAATAGTEPTTPAKAAPEPESSPAQDGAANEKDKGNSFDDDW